LRELRTDINYSVANIGHMVGDISADAQAMFGTIFITSAFTFGIPEDPEHKDELEL